MAAPNEILAPRYNQLLYRLLAMQEGAPAPVLATEIFPMLGLEMDRLEWKFLTGTQLVMGTAIQLAVAGQFSHVCLQNPVKSGVLVVIEDVLVQAESTVSGGAVGTIFTGTTTLTNANAAIHRDLRASSNPGSNLGTVGQIRVGANVSATPPGVSGLSVVDAYQVLSSQVIQTQRRLGVVLEPGSGFGVSSVVANQGWRATYRWYERTFEPSEGGGL
ncbi:MAG: hypothetical protein L0214_15005 [candidate division NC10 bacterium]|nr:hypothetical protein [candidate division NC10 bacterium]